MESEIPTMSVSLEEPGLANEAPPVETPPPAVETPPPAPNPEDAEPEGLIATATGEKYVPLGAVKAERERRQQEKQAREKVEKELAELKPRAEAWERDRQYVEQAKPYIEALRQRGIDSLKAPQAPPQEPQGPLTPQQAEAFAHKLDLYDTGGKKDVARAQEIAKIVADLVQEQTGKLVSPLVQNEAQRQSAALYQQYLQKPEVHGVKIDARYLAEAWNVVPPELIAQNPAVGEILYRTALANQFMAGGKPIQAPPPAVPTESVGSGTPKEVALDSRSQRFQQASNMKPADFRDTREKYNPNGPNSLE